MPPGNMSWVIRDRLGSASRLGHIRSVPKRFESRAHRDDGIDQLNYLEESLVCLAQVNGRTIARSTSAHAAGGARRAHHQQRSQSNTRRLNSGAISRCQPHQAGTVPLGRWTAKRNSREPAVAQLHATRRATSWMLQVTAASPLVGTSGDAAKSPFSRPGRPGASRPARVTGAFSGVGVG